MGTQRLETDPVEIRAQAFLTINSTSHSRTLEVGDFLTIGRDLDNMLVIEDDFISARHARIERKEFGFLLRDFRSSNGTFVNSTRINEAWLQDHDRIRIGQTELCFSFQKDPQSAGFSLRSQNPKWNTQLQRLPAMATSEFPILILGPSGSGKEVLARVIHQNSHRRHRPFISVNCSALTESLVESELFGHVRGSFTGATHDREGAFEAARGGTLFLDEIGDLSINLQPKLLRALENNEIKPVGSDQCISTDVRVLAATHQDLLRKVRAGEFREDLFYRLNVLQIKTPPLNQRKEDFEELLYRFAKEFRVGFSLAAIQRLKEHKWPGNIRELRNTVARAAAYFKGGRVEENQVDQLIEKVIFDPSEDRSAMKGIQLLKSFEKEMICERLMANNGNQRKTAEDLGMPKSTLHDRIKTYNINIKELGHRD